MVKQYPYDLFFSVSSPGYTDDNGFWVSAGPPIETLVSKCRDEANSGGNMLSDANGNRVAFDTLIQAPKGVQLPAPGTVIVVKDGQTERVRGVVIRSRKDQFHVRIWV